MKDLFLAFYWHQHQPYYPDDVGGDNPMPWVRLHGVKDYYGMALHLLEVPEMRCTINLVPSLLVQLQAYTEHGKSDRMLDVSRIPADGLSESDALFILDHFFMANPQHMVRPFPRYFDLYTRRALGRSSSKDVLRRFNERDLRDLQVWFNLTWIHPLALDSDLKALMTQGRHYSEADKNLVLDRHLEILKKVIPLHRDLAARGQVELTTTPFYHPILPLLLDKRLAREAMPDVKLPRYAGGYAEDAALHVKRAVEEHTRIFGKAPRGLWPAEGSVCQSMIPLLGQHGIRWFATDEGVLSQSTQGFVSRDSQGHARNPEHLYRPYKVREGEHELNIVFRDHALSDMIGFHYQRSDAAAAAADFLKHMHNISQAVQSDRPPLVSIILDGENCWEHYAEGGVPFLRHLYKLCTETPGLHTVRLGDYLEQHPPRDSIPYLSAGSWINHNFAIWIGHEEDNTAWDALQRTREHLRARAQQGHIAAERIRQAWEEIYIAEGSDWYWWFGDDHSSAQDMLFDYLFRKHLQNVYLLLGDPPPPDLSRPIKRRGHKAMHSLPRNFLDVKIDGRQTFFEWIGAGKYTCQNERGTMAMVSRGPMKEVHFGFDREALLIRVDFDRSATVALAEFEALRISFAEPSGWEIVIERAGKPEQQVRVLHEGVPQGVDAGVEVAIDQIVELAVPFALLRLDVDRPIHFYVELLESRQSRDRAPREGTIHLTCPSPDFEQIMWDV